MHETKSTCCYCGTGCGVVIESDGARIIGVRGDPDHPANFGRLCSKGASLHLTPHAPTRALHPELRESRTTPRHRVPWDAALDHAAARFADIMREHGPDAVAFYISGQLLTEDYYVFNKLARALVGTHNIDSNSRLCMSSAVVAYAKTLGADAPPASYEDIELADCMLIAGANPAFAHPIVFRRIEAAKRANPDLRLIVIDPRRTDTAEAADLHLALQPGTDTLLFSALLHVLLWEDLIDRDFIRAHTAGFDALREQVRETTPAAVAGACGVKAEDIVTAARWFGHAKNALSFWCQGLNQSVHGTESGAALIHLHLATGQIGRPGTGPFSLTGQPNAMGGRETGSMATLLPGHRSAADAAHRAEVARYWGVPALPEKPGRTAVELFDALHAGEIKAVWIACTNPAQSLPDQAKVRAALSSAEFVVLQEAYRGTETAEFADLLLPAAAWGEKAGTVTNSERRISRVRAAVPAPGEARPDWKIAHDFALALGLALGRSDAPRLFDFAGPEAIHREFAELTRGRDLDITGLDYALLDRAGPQQWPLPEGAAVGTARLYENKRFATPDGRARFIPIGLATTAEATDARYPFHLNTGRLRDQWHGMSRSGTVARLFGHEEEALAHLHPSDLARRGLNAGELLLLSSRRGTAVLRAVADDSLRPGQAFVPMHWGRSHLNGGGVNELTLSAFDPHSKQPELKHAAIRIERAALPWQALVVRSEAHEGEAVAWRERLQPLLARFGYACLSLAGRAQQSVVLRLAHTEAAPAEWLDEIDTLLGLDDPFCLRFRDVRRGVRKTALVEEGALVGLSLAGETAAGAWLKEAVVERQPVADFRRWLLAPVATPPQDAPRASRIVCACHGVSERALLEDIAAGATLDELQSKTKCGTGCGSCLPEIKRMLLAAQRAA